MSSTTTVSKTPSARRQPNATKTPVAATEQEPDSEVAVHDNAGVVSRSDLQVMTDTASEQLVLMLCTITDEFQVRERGQCSDDACSEIVDSLNNQTEKFNRDFPGIVNELVGKVEYVVGAHYSHPDKLFYFPQVPPHYSSGGLRQRDMPGWMKRAPYGKEIQKVALLTKYATDIGMETGKLKDKIETYLGKNLSGGRYDFWRCIEMFIAPIPGWEETVNRITQGVGVNGVTLFWVQGGRAARLVSELLVQWTENWLPGVKTTIDLSTSTRRILQEQSYSNQNLRTPLLEFWRMVIYDVSGRFAGWAPSGRLPVEQVARETVLDVSKI